MAAVSLLPSRGWLVSALMIGGLGIATFFVGLLVGTTMQEAPTIDYVAGGQAGSGPEARLEEENQRLRSELESLRALQHRVPVTSAALPAGAADVPGAGILADLLTADLKQQLEAKSIDLNAVSAALIQILVRGRLPNDPARALALLRSTGGDAGDDAYEGFLSEQIAAAFAATGNTSGEADALAYCLAKNGPIPDVIHRLAQINQPLATSILTAMLNAADPQSQQYIDLKEQLGLSLLASPNPEDGRRILDDLMARPGWSFERSGRYGALSASYNMNDRFAELDPRGSIARFTTQLASSDDPNTLRLLIVKASAKLGDHAVVNEHLSALFEEDPYNARALEAMERYDAQAHLRYLGQLVRRDAPWHIHADYARKLSAAGRARDAADAIAGAWSKNPEASFGEFLRLAPERSVDTVLDYARRPATTPKVAAEMIGSAGDAQWLAGKHVEAQACWREAAERDPVREAAWRRRLDGCRDGRSPLR